MQTRLTQFELFTDLHDLGNQEAGSNRMRTKTHDDTQGVGKKLQFLLSEELFRPEPTPLASSYILNHDTLNSQLTAQHTVVRLEPDLEVISHTRGLME